MKPNAVCKAMRTMMLEEFDGGKACAPAVASHVTHCAACRRFGRFLSGYRARLSAAFEPGPRSLKPVDFRILESRRRKTHGKRFAFALSGIAAALMITAGALVAGAAVNAEQERVLIRQETDFFVEDLFSRTLFEGIEYLAADQEQAAAMDQNLHIE